MKKVLFIDRDGTIIWEPPDTFQIDSFEKLKFLPGVFTWLGKIARELDYELVMVTNQDGLGTKKYPQEIFDTIKRLVIETLNGEGIKFSEICIDNSFEEENKPTRKPGTAMLTKYMNGAYDLKNSFTIGDRLTDVKLAQNLGSGCIFIKNYDEVNENEVTFLTDTWENIYKYLSTSFRF